MNLPTYTRTKAEAQILAADLFPDAKTALANLKAARSAKSVERARSIFWLRFYSGPLLSASGLCSFVLTRPLFPQGPVIKHGMAAAFYSPPLGNGYVEKFSLELSKFCHKMRSNSFIYLRWTMKKTNGLQHATVVVMDLQGFSKISQADYNKTVEHVYCEIANVLHKYKDSLIDRKTIGDGFMFYFSQPKDAIEFSFKLRHAVQYVQGRENFQSILACRIALHCGGFSQMMDQIENRMALFGRDIIPAARLEPIVRPNEIWCTRAFKEDCAEKDVPENFKFSPLCVSELAKGWKKQEIYGVYDSNTEKPPKPVRIEPTRISYNNNNCGDFKHTYFALIRLKDRSGGVVHLRRELKVPDYYLEAVYYVFGNYDILVRFKTKKEIQQSDLANFLVKERISKDKEKCRLTEIHFNVPVSKEPIDVFSDQNERLLKAFTYIRSESIVSSSTLTRAIVKLATRSCGSDGVATHYTNKSHLILPFVIPIEKYYALAKAIEKIERFVDNNADDDDRATITTYPVHGFEEFYLRNGETA